MDWRSDGKQIAVLGWETLDIWNVASWEMDKRFTVMEWMDEVFCES